MLTYGGGEASAGPGGVSRFTPFNPVDKYTVAWVRNNRSSETVCLMKGAPQVFSNILVMLIL